MKLVCKMILIAFLGLFGLAQESTTPRVAIPLIANGPHHRPTNVTVESLAIVDQKKPVTGATLLRGADLPLELGVLIDASNSQRDTPLNDFVKAANQFVDDIVRGPEDRVFFLQFRDKAEATGWLKKGQSQDAGINLRIGGGTALYEAVAMASKERLGPRDWQKPTRRVLLLISDGEDNMSRITRDEAVAEVLKAGAVVFTINPRGSGMSSKGEKIMENWVKLTGGESFDVISGKDTPKVFANIQETIGAMVYLSYVPPDPSKSAVHEVEMSAPREKIKLSYAGRYFWTP